MLSILWAVLLPFALGGTLKVDITKDTPGTKWSSGWSPVIGTQYFGGTLMSVRDAGATLTYSFTGTKISVYGTEGTSSSKQANSSYTLDGSTPLLHQGSTTVVTSNVLFYGSPLLEDAEHTLVIQDLVAGGGLQLDYFEVTRSTAKGGRLTSTFLLQPRSTNPKDGSLQPAVIAGLVLASVAVLTGFIILSILWRRQYLRERREKSERYPKAQLRGDAQKAPFLNEHTRVGPFTSVSSQPSQSSQTSRTTTPVVMTVTPLHPQPSREQVVATSSSHRDEKRLLPTGQVYTMESISRLNLGLNVNPRDHSVVGQPSNYESEASVPPHRQRNRENDGGVSLLGSSETINPKVLRLPPDYRRFYS
ncbi:hypothetical protein BDM02DRAFT_3182728 [Thelephora ganbajun]|uniref:Uncharacterized protein n=1 Tax=Thelephora ganbajun TaxID=370292 RepID=A0ACB6ZVP6_THEGA|nr:hypothetical protein BDM02DRAFT_3182728 [Thelephora ganbajun]